MTYVQLIEKVSLPTQLWLTFWNLTESTQMSMEIGMPLNEYEVGQVFRLDRNERNESLALQLVTDPGRLAFEMPIPVPSVYRTDSALGSSVKSGLARVVTQQPPNSPALAPEIVTFYCK